MNPAAERVFGYEREQVLRRALVDLIIPLRSGTPTDAVQPDVARSTTISSGCPRCNARNLRRVDRQPPGSGMDHDVAADVSEPFFTTKPKGNGTRLRLTTV